MFRFRLVCLLLAALSWEAFAQTATSVIFGTVTDASGSSVPNVTVTATNAATQVSERVTTNEAGNYVFPNLRPGTYTVSCEVSGFRKSEVTNVLVEVNQRGRVDPGVRRAPRAGARRPPAAPAAHWPRLGSTG